MRIVMYVCTWGGRVCGVVGDWGYGVRSGGIVRII